MQTLLCSLLLLGRPLALTEPPPQTLNQYVAFLSQSVDVVNGRCLALKAYEAEVQRYRKKADGTLRLPSSGPLETYYYQKALAATGLTAAEQQSLKTSAQGLWQRLNQIDQTGKALETYVRLGDYRRDNLSRSDSLVRALQTLASQFGREKDACYQQIRQMYRRYQPYQASDPYLVAEHEMEQVLQSQQALLSALPFVLHDDSPAAWPVDRVQQHMLADAEPLQRLDQTAPRIAYPASSMLASFKTALQTIQALKSRAIDDNTYAARQSARHGNEVYLALLQAFNQDLLAMYHSFVNYSRSARSLLDYPSVSITFLIDPPAPVSRTVASAVPFADSPPLVFSVQPATAPASRATFLALNAYVDFINESLRQLRTLQVGLRNYQLSAEYQRDPARSQKRAALTYAHDDYKLPTSLYQLLRVSSQSVPPSYRASVVGQAEVLMNMLTEMDQLSIELTTYTADKRYQQDQLQRSDAILDRYAYLFDAFDQKKERLYTDIRRIYESYPAASPGSSWNRAGKALLSAVDSNRAVLAGIRAYLSGQSDRLPETASLEAMGRQLMADEYSNLNGLTRYGRSNGLCPYTPYEDLAESSLRFAELTKRIALPRATATSHPYESVYYFYNNQLIYPYNRFCELAKENRLKAIDQPDLFAFRRQASAPVSPPAPLPVSPPESARPRREPPPSPATTPATPVSPTSAPVAAGPTLRDTVYVERLRVDTMYVDRSREGAVSPSLAGFAPNNMVLLLDVSGSMDSPYKLPLLKRSVKALLTLLRPEDQLSIVVYSGKARVALKPTSGAHVGEIARVIDELTSTGDTDGNGGLKLAYKVADRNYIRAGNNRIILATDGEFAVSGEVLQLIEERARQDISLTVFTFGRNALTGQGLRQLSQLGRGTFVHVTPQNATNQLILEAQARPVR
ncbi:vWA domain-containing protein [Spirosoma sordidisoli]|uniref:VWA domain-containing protein n=1 Tax=Spirosoma sordidisoli TaxID=2502893 RepID=A0A4Q2UVR5_9BACT|nr:VWA domain-containing protein [Spirosoma sordidisoli]RYC72111.1 VWA domain-containing protein [Spirosoma sordidisoli]